MQYMQLSRAIGKKLSVDLRTVQMNVAPHLWPIQQEPALFSTVFNFICFTGYQHYRCQINNTLFKALNISENLVITENKIEPGKSRWVFCCDDKIINRKKEAADLF